MKGQLAAMETRGKKYEELRKRAFRQKDARRLGNSGTKQGPEWKVRKDYKARGLLP